MQAFDYNKILKKAYKLPDEIQLCDPDGQPYDDGLISLDQDAKIALATLMLKWKQGLETTVVRVLKNAIKRYEND